MNELKPHSKYTYTEPPTKWYWKLVPEFLWDAYEAVYSFCWNLKFDLCTKHTGRFKMWNIMHEDLNNHLKDKL